MSREFLEEDGSIELDTRQSAQDALDALKRKEYDVVISDYSMPPGMNSIDLLKLLRKEKNDIPFIIFTGRGREEVAMEALNNGAAFYLQKGAHPEVQYTELKNMILQLADRRHAEKALRERELENRMILENVPVLIYTVRYTNGDPVITTLNPAFERLTGLSADESLGKPFTSLLHPDDVPPLLAVMDTIRQGKNPEPCEVRIRTKDTTYIILEITSVPLWEGNTCTGNLGIAMNVTDLRRNLRLLESQRKELEAKNQELESFAYSVSHDLRAPLRIIDGYAELIREKYGDALPEEVMQPFSRIQVAARRMDSMIGQILALSRSSRAALRVQTLDLSAMANEILETHRREEPDRSIITIVEPGITAEGDKTLIQTVLQNLLDNAWKFTGHTPSAEIQFGMTQNGSGPVYYVKDNGAGFDAAHAEKLWMPFSRYHRESEFPGNGIGLAMVRKILERHDGRIRVESEVGKGATFSFTLMECTNEPP